jgi:hypothetical protein
MKKLMGVLVATAMAVTMAGVPADANSPTPTAYIDGSGFYGTPEGGFGFTVWTSRGQPHGFVADAFSVTALGVTYTATSPEVTDLTWYDGGTNNMDIEFRLVTADPTLQPQASDFTDASVVVHVTWRTASYKKVRHAIRGSFSKHGTATASRGWTRLGFGGSCNYLASSGELLVTCLAARSTVTYTMTAPRVHHHRTRITGASLSKHSGIFACRTSVYTTRLSKRTMRVTAVTANASGFAQCWLEKVKASYRGHYTTKHKVYLYHDANVLAEYHVA